jgi:hypothetical protein
MSILEDLLIGLCFAVAASLITAGAPTAMAIFG